MGTARVLIVEDNTTVAMDISESLTAFGYLVTAMVASGEEAIECAGRDCPDVVLMDVELCGDMDGIEAAQRIHAEFDIPVLFLSAYSDHDLLERAKQAGSFGYLVKPFEERELYAMLEMTLFRARTERERKQAEEQRMESLGVLAGGVAHSLNNMLGVISGYSDLALDALSPDSEIRGFIEQQLVAVARASQTVEQILAFSRLSEMDKSIVDLGDLARDTVELLQRSLPSSVNLQLDVAPDVPPVLADEARLQQVIMSLCINARDAMPDGGELALVLKAHQVEHSDANQGLAPGVHAHLEVRDTGSGMPPEVRDRVFEPFFTTKEIGQGTGMGLATSYGIVTAHGGLVSVESEEGVGSTFHVYLPAAKGSPEVGGGPVDEAPLACARVLVVEDEPALLEMASALLRSLGHHVTAFSRSPDALSALKRSPDEWDLVLTAQKLPCCDGLEIVRRVKKLRPDLPVVLMTGRSDKIADGSDAGVGADAVLKKPFRRQSLAETMGALLPSGSKPRQDNKKD